MFVDANGQLGTISSSMRYQEDVDSMGDASLGLLELRPLTFMYREGVASGPQRLQYGLIAEEVAEIYPELVTYTPSGEVETVQYQKVNAMLLNEVQREHQQIQEQGELIANLMERLVQLERIAAQGDLVPIGR